MNDFLFGVLLALFVAQVAIMGWNFKAIFLRKKKEQQLIEAYRDYVNFLHKYIGRRIGFLNANGWGDLDREIEDEAEIRRKIYQLKEEIK